MSVLFLLPVCLFVTWHGCDLLPSHPQEVSDVQLPDIEGHSIPLKLFDQLLLSVAAATANTNQD